MLACLEDIRVTLKSGGRPLERIDIYIERVYIALDEVSYFKSKVENYLKK